MGGARSDRGRSGAALAAAALLVGAGSGFALGRTTGGAEPGPEPGSVEAVAEELAAGQAADRAASSAELARAARTAHDQLGQVLRAMAPVVPVEGAATSAGPAGDAAPVTADDAAAWAAQAGAAAQALSAVPEGTAAFDVTRQALLASARMLADTAEELSSALTTPGLAPGEVEPVAAQRDAAVQLWQAGAEQLDGLVVEAGQEHVHLFLVPSGDPDAVPLEFQEPDAP